MQRCAAAQWSSLSANDRATCPALIVSSKTAQNLKEKLFVILVFTGIFLPVRLFFYSYVSEVWVGSFVVMTAIFVAFLWASKKGWLSWVGNVCYRQVVRTAKGRIGKLALGMSIFFLFVFGNVIYGIENAPQQTKQHFEDTMRKAGIEDFETLQQKSQNLSWQTPQGTNNLLFSIFVILVPNRLGHTMFSVINDLTDGWMLHFVTVYFIEELEIMGFMMYFRYVSKST